MKPEWGSRRQCKKCGAAFYDLHREEFDCPKCNTGHKLADFIIKSRADVRKERKKAAAAAVDEPELLDDEEIKEVLEEDELLEEDEDISDEDIPANIEREDEE